MATALSDSVEQLIHECWLAGRTAKDCHSELNGAATLRQIQIRFSRYAEQSVNLETADAVDDPLTVDLLDSQLDSETKEAVVLNLMEHQIARLHHAARNPRKVAIDLKSERLLKEALESILKAYRERPYEV